MIEQNKKINISQELERAKDCLKSAELLHSQVTEFLQKEKLL